MGSRLEAAVIFESAAWYIRRYGWQVSGMGMDGGPRCSMGALASAHPQPVWDTEVSALMYRALNDELDGINLTQFNATQHDGEAVAELFERTALKLRSLAGPT